MPSSRSYSDQMQSFHFFFFKSVADLDAVTEERNAARRTYDDLRRMRLEMFMDGFGKISLKLKELYQTITFGGDVSFVHVLLFLLSTFSAVSQILLSFVSG